MLSIHLGVDPVREGMMTPLMKPESNRNKASRNLVLLLALLVVYYG